MLAARTFRFLILKISLYRCRLLSKVTFGETKEHYTHKKTAFRDHIKKMEISRRGKNFSIFKIMQNLIRQDLYIFFDCLQSTIIEEIDVLTLFEYCQNNNITAKYIAKKDGSLYKNMNGTVPRDIIFIEDLKNKYLTKELFFILIRAKALITSFGDINDSLEKMLMGSKKTEYISIGHGSMFFR